MIVDIDSTLDINPTDLDQQVLATDPSESDDPLDPNTPTEQAEEPKDTDIEIVKDGDSINIELPKIIIKGQLGKLFTDELNKLYSITELKTNKISIEPEENNGQQYLADESFIYTVDMKSINKEGLHILLDELLPATENYKNVICYIENNDSLNKNIDVALKWMNDNNVKVYFSKNNLMSALEGLANAKS